MKKTLLFILYSFFFLGGIGATTPALQWVATGDGVEMEIPETIKANAEGDVFILADFYSSTLPDIEVGPNKVKHGVTTDYTLYDPLNGASTIETTSTGAPDNLSVNGTPNLVLYKIDKTGRVIWKVNSNVGHFYGGVMAPTSDGGVVLGLKMKHSVQATYEPGTLLRLIDSKGQAADVLWDAPDYSIYGGVYQPVLVKIDGAGEVEWTKRISVDYKTETIGGSIKKFNDNFDFSDMAVDAENNIYITGNYRTAINFGRQANLSSPHNTAGWDGDIQKTRGDMFLVKLDASGSAKWNVVTQGEVVCERPGALDFDGSNLYLTGYMKGDNDKSMSVKLGETRLTPSGSDCLYYASISTEGAVNWARLIEAEKNAEGAARIKPMCISVNREEGALLMGGSFFGNMLDGTNKILENPNPSTMGLRAYLLQCNPETGEVQQTYARIVGGLTEVESAYRVGGKIHAVAYELYNSEYLVSFDAELNGAEEHKLFACTQISSQGGVIVDGLLIAAGRARTESLGIVTFPGTDFQFKTKEGGWACIFTCHKLSGDVSVCSTENTPAFNAYSSAGKLIIESLADCRVRIYNVSGQLIKDFEMESGGVWAGQLTKGLYIVNDRKVIVY